MKLCFLFRDSYKKLFGSKDSVVEMEVLEVAGETMVQHVLEIVSFSN